MQVQAWIVGVVLLSTWGGLLLVAIMLALKSKKEKDEALRRVNQLESVIDAAQTRIVSLGSGPPLQSSLTVIDDVEIDQAILDKYLSTDDTFVSGAIGMSERDWVLQQQPRD